VSGKHSRDTAAYKGDSREHTSLRGIDLNDIGPEARHESLDIDDSPRVPSRVDLPNHVWQVVEGNAVGRAGLGD
jgi:hypothetical protein